MPEAIIPIFADCGIIQSHVRRRINLLSCVTESDSNNEMLAFCSLCQLSAVALGICKQGQEHHQYQPVTDNENICSKFFLVLINDTGLELKSNKIYFL